VRLARANRVPDLNVGPSIRRLEATNDMAAVFSVSIPIPVFNNGRAAIAQATAQRTQADAQRRVTALDIEQAITDAQAQAANAATTARAASGPALAAAQEAARIARIGYREGKFGQLELLDAERTLADTRVAAIDALANYQNARAQVERLTARAPNGGISDEELLSRGRGVARPALGCLRRQGWRKRGNCRTAANETAAGTEKGGAEGGHAGEGVVTLGADQIATAGVQVGRPIIGGAGTIELPAIIEGDPQGTQVVSAAIAGRVVALTRNLGQSVGRGQTIAVIESREAAQIKGEVEAARARLQLANSNLAREQRLFAQRVSPEQDLIAARTAATEARIALTQAQSMVSAAGVGGGGLNRLGIAAPISGQIIARPVTLGQTVAADAELYRIANLSQVSIALNLKPEDAGRVRPGNTVLVKAAGRQATARVTFVSPALDPQTRLVPALATLDNRGGEWRVGEPVTAAVQLTGSGGSGAVRVPTTAVQSFEGKSVVFVRTPTGFKATPVQLGDASGDTVIVRSGLTGNEQIATTGSFTLKAEIGKGEASHED
jgi:cobalt-zinc-cadmium efflux system membrane fusion protein